MEAERAKMKFVYETPEQSVFWRNFPREERIRQIRCLFKHIGLTPTVLIGILNLRHQPEANRADVLQNYLENEEAFPFEDRVEGLFLNIMFHSQKIVDAMKSPCFKKFCYNRFSDVTGFPIWGFCPEQIPGGGSTCNCIPYRGQHFIQRDRSQISNVNTTATNIIIIKHALWQAENSQKQTGQANEKVEEDKKDESPE